LTCCGDIWTASSSLDVPAAEVAEVKELLELLIVCDELVCL